MKCEKCGNEDTRFFYLGSKGYYCRKCIRYKQVDEMQRDFKLADSQYYLDFELSEKQKIISTTLANLVNQGKSVLLEAVTGARQDRTCISNHS